MGVGLGTALLIGAGLGTVGAVAGSAISSHGAQVANEAAMNFNADQAAINRSYQTMMYERQKLDQENFYKQYQSPKAIANALSGLGVNPASIFSTGQSVGGSASSMPSVPSGAQASIGSLLNPLAPYSEGLQGVTGQAAQMLSVISDSKLKDAQTLHVLKQAYGQEFTNQMLEISASIAHWKIPEEAKANINDLMASAALKNANGKLVEAQTEVEKIMKIVRQNDATIGSQQILEMSIRLSHLDRLLNNQEQLGLEQVKTEKSKQSSNYASAKLSNQQASTERYRTSIQKIESEKFEKNKVALIKSFGQQLIRDNILSQADQREYAIKLARYQDMIDAREGDEAASYLDSFLDWLKDKVSIFK